MKKLLIFIFTFNQCFGQNLSLSTDKTTSLVFPFPILHVDKGTQDIITQPVKEPGNILLVKAASKNFAETNLSVVISDGSVYTFKVSYTDNPDKWVFYLRAKKDESVATYANGILDNTNKRKYCRVRKNGVSVSVNGIYIRDEVMYYQLLICNH